MPDNETIANALTSERKRRKLSQEETLNKSASVAIIWLKSKIKANNISLDVYRSIVSWLVEVNRFGKLTVYCIAYAIMLYLHMQLGNKSDRKTGEKNESHLRYLWKRN